LISRDGRHSHVGATRVNSHNLLAIRHLPTFHDVRLGLAAQSHHRTRHMVSPAIHPRRRARLVFTFTGQGC
jgi:hypothetical protein